MPSEAEMRAHNGDTNYGGTGPESVVSIPRSGRGPHGPSGPYGPYGPNGPRRPQDDLQSIRSTATNARPTLNIYATLNGDIAYETDPRWERAFGRSGYKVNCYAVPNLNEIDQAGILYSQYTRQPHGTCRVNGVKIPLVYTQDGPVYTAPGFEHGRIYAPLMGPPQGEIRQVQPRPQQQRNGKGEKKGPLEGINGIACALGVSVCCLAACILPFLCHL